MSQEVTISSLKSILKFPFEGSDAKTRFLVGSALIFACFFIPIIPCLFVCGYIFAVMRQTVRAEKLTMPAWTDWGKLFVDGLKVTLVQLLLTLPAGLVYTVGMLAYFGSVMVVSISSNGRSGDLAALIPMLIAMAVFFFSLFFGSLLLLLGLIPLPAALACMAERDSLSGAFAIGDWTRALMRNKLGYFLAWVVMMGLYALFSFGLTLAYYSVILCIIIPIVAAPISFYLGLVFAALFGQVYHESAAQPADPSI